MNISGIEEVTSAAVESSSPSTRSGVGEEPIITPDQDSSSSNNSSGSLNINTDRSPTSRAHDANIATLLERLASTEAKFLRERASTEALRGALSALQRRAAAAADTRDVSCGGPTANTPRDSCNRGASSSAGVIDADSSENLRGDSRDGTGSRGRGGETDGCRPGERPPWKNILYKRQPYPDNHVPQSFLEKLVTNAYVRQPDLRLYVVNTFAVTQQISAVTLFLVVFMHMQDGLISMTTMVMVDLLLLFGGYATVFLVSPKCSMVQSSTHEREGKGTPSLARCDGGLGFKAGDPFDTARVARGTVVSSFGTAAGLSGDDGEALEELSLFSVSSTLASFLLFLAILRIMAPVLRTLTVSYSSDTIYALAVTFSFLHLAFHDYSYANTASGHFQGTLSLNAAIFAAVLLASRLESNEKVFGLVLFALELFAFFPLARREVKRHSLLLHASVTSAMVLPTGLLLFVKHPTLFAAYVGTVVLVTFACPLWLLRVQRYKLRIEGPWDIAHVEAHHI